MKKILLFALVAGAVAFSSYISSNKKPQVFKGPEVKVHGGKAWSWIQLNKQGNPERMGVALSEDALNSVPAGS